MGLTRPRASQIQNIDYKQTARAVTTSNIANLSGGAPATVDGVSLAKNNRVLVTGQSTGSENGIYKVTTVGAGSNGTWARTTDSDATGDLNAGTIIMITEGTTYADVQFKLTTDDPITIGTTALTFTQVGNSAFGIVAVSGQDNLVADTIGDTLTVSAGTNLTATTTAASDTITLTPSLTPDLTSATFTNTTTGDTLLLTTTEDSSTAAPVITMKRNSASPADADYLGQLKFKGENDADQEVVYVKVTGKIQDASDGTEDGLLEFANRKAGSNNINMRLRSDSLQLLNGTNFQIREQQDARFYDSDSSNYIGLKAPATVASDVDYILPADGTSGQVLQTDGSGTLSFTTISSGSAANQFPNCTVSPLPGSEGNFDLAKQYDQSGSVESPFEAISTDAFGVSLGEIYTMMDPVGSTITTDLGSVA